MTHEEFMAQSQASIDKAVADSSKWFADRKQRFELEDLQAELDSDNKMWGDHDKEMERIGRDSQDRIAKYQQAADDILSAARQPVYENAGNESSEEVFDSPETEDDGMAQELVNRMDERG